MAELAGEITGEPKINISRHYRSPNGSYLEASPRETKDARNRNENGILHQDCDISDSTATDPPGAAASNI